MPGWWGRRQKLLSEFLHDLKSPLASLLSYARLVRENNVLLDDRTRGQLDVIEGKSEELARQLEDVTLEQVARSARRFQLDTIYFLKGKEA